MLSVHVMTNVPPLARSYQDGGCRIAERVGIGTTKNKQTKQDKTNKEQLNKTKKETKQNKTRQNQQGASKTEAVELRRGWVLEQ